MNNAFCCYLPEHCSHGLQPLDNSIFNVVKATYRKELQKLATLIDSALVDKVNFTRIYANARQVAMVTKSLLSGWRVTGNWPISRSKALRHSEIQENRREVTPDPAPESDSDSTPKTSRHIRSPTTEKLFTKVSKAFEA